VGVLAITLKETLSWTRRFGVDQNTSVLIFGTGPVGVAFVMFAKQLGADNVFLAGRTPSSIERAAAMCHPTATINVADGDVAEKAKELTGGAGIDRVIEGVGDTSIIDLGIECLSPEGRVGVYGVPPSTDPDAVHKTDTRVSYIAPDEAEVHDEFFDMVRRGDVDPWVFMSHRMDHREIDRGFEMLESREAFKVLLDW
jgi:threonine dehydrogenase-like Zn-dependent dehydrogenase